MPSVCRRMRHRFGQERAENNMSALQALSSERLRIFMIQNGAVIAMENLPESVVGGGGGSSSENAGLLLLDCRPFLAYNKSHIEGAINVHCPAILRRRNGGRLPLRTVIPSADIRQSLADGCCHPVVLYDEQKFCPQHSQLRNSLTSAEDSMAIFVAKCLQTELNLKNIFILEGGYHEFRLNFPGLCRESHHSDPRTLCPRAKISPTSVYITNGNNNLVRHGSSPLSGYTSPQDCPVEILPHLFLGDAYHASERDILQRLGITALLNVSDTLPNHFEDTFTYKSIPVQDSCSEDIGSWFEEAINFIEDVKAQNGRVLVHCRAGISRSATICIAYLMSTKRLRMEEAYEFVKLRRRIVSPNFNFMGQLLTFESQVFGGPCVRPVSPLPAVSPVSMDPDPDTLTPSRGASQNQPVFDFAMTAATDPLTRSPAKTIVLGTTVFIS